MQVKNRLLFVTYFYPPIGGAGLPGAQRAVKFIKYLNNFEIYVLTVNENDYPVNSELNFKRKLPINNEYICRTSFKSIFSYVLQIRKMFRIVFRCSQNYSETLDKPTSPKLDSAINSPHMSILQRIKDIIYELCNFPDYASGWILPAVKAGQKILRSKKFDIIFATGTPWSALVIAWILHKISGVKLVIDFRDPWVGNPFDVNNCRMLDRLKCFLERKIVEDASLVTANTVVLKEELLERYADMIDINKIIVLPNGFDPEDYESINVDTTDNVLSDENRLTLAHGGGLYGKRDPAIFFEALKLIEYDKSNNLSDFLFVQMGAVGLDYSLSDRYSELIDQGVFRCDGMVPYHECLRRLKSADVLVLLQPGTKSQIPSKLYDYVCLNRPIITITPMDGALGKLVKQYGFGYVFDPQDIKGISDLLKKLRDEKKQNGCLVFEYPNRETFNIINIAAVLSDHIRQVIRHQ